MTTRVKKPKLPPIRKGTAPAPRAPRDYAHGYRYELRKPNQQPKDYARFTSFTSATNAMRKEIKDARAVFQRMQVDDAVACCNRILAMIGWLDGDGGKVVGVLDPFTGIKYRAELVRLEAS